MSGKESLYAAYMQKGRILNRQFQVFLFPMLVSEISIALSEVVDGIVVAKLLGTDALAVVTLGSPIMFLAATLQMLLGKGGSILYSKSMGEMKRNAASDYFNASMWSTLVIGLAVTIAVLVFHTSLTTLLAAGSAFYSVLKDYLFYLFISLAPIMLVSVFVQFLPSFGMPHLASICIFIANTVNLLLDVVYIRFFGMGVGGAALATLSGYAVAGILIIALAALKKLSLSVKLWRLPHISRICQRLPKIIGLGVSDASTQVGFALLTTYCNFIANRYGGSDAIIVLSICLQTQSITSIVLCGISDSLVPIVAMLSGQRDYLGIRILIRRAAEFLLVSVLILTLSYIINPLWLCKVFSEEKESVQTLFVHAVRIFALYFPLRSLVILHRNVSNAMGRGNFAFIVSLLDGFVGIITFSLILCPIFGMDGLWLTYPVNAVFVALFVWLSSIFLRARSTPAKKGIFLLPVQNEDDLLNLEFISKDSDISKVSQAVQEFCTHRGISDKVSQNTGLLAEEMALYARKHHLRYPYIDIIVLIEDGKVILEFRSIGHGFQPDVFSEEDDKSNIQILNGVSCSLEYEYVVGLNTTKITL